MVRGPAPSAVCRLVMVPNADVLNVVLGPKIGWLLGMPIISIELTTGREDGGKPGLVSISIDPMGADCEMNVGAAKDISWLGVI